MSRNLSVDWISDSASSQPIQLRNRYLRNPSTTLQLFLKSSISYSWQLTETLKLLKFPVLIAPLLCSRSMSSSCSYFCVPFLAQTYHAFFCVSFLAHPERILINIWKKPYATCLQNYCTFVSSQLSCLLYYCCCFLQTLFSSIALQHILYV